MLSFKLKRKNAAYYAISICLIVAVASFAHGGYLLIKAQLAQYLLHNAWQQQTVVNKLKHNNIVKPWPWADIYPVAKLSFERFNITQIVLNNDSGQALAFGPGLNKINISSIENYSPNVVVISAHNDTHFSMLSEFQLNDRVTLTLKSGRAQIFKVNNIAIMDTRTEQLVLPNYDEKMDSEQNDYFGQNKLSIKELVLVTCYPFIGVNDETTLRYVVYLS